ncbi:MAG: DUF4038 domain-containing protein [Propionibacterium sp.]|nr:DUF4038 domain-containing protein [Propionibacterium sp.]
MAGDEYAAVEGGWGEVEISFTADGDLDNPYVDVEFWVEFIHDDRTVIRRPGFWRGGHEFAVRFASGGRLGRWTWRSHSSPVVAGLDGCHGSVHVEGPARGGGRFARHGFWRMSDGGRSLVHADGTPAILVADTAWALPWRAMPEDARHYAARRAAQGFNAVLLMSVQPDMDAEGPDRRDADGGFARGFFDLPSGHLSQLNPEYFDTLDELVGILRAADIVPVLQPVFFGWGWKGLRVAGPVLPLDEYARYCRYLVARYGAGPVMYLVGADGSGHEPQVAAGGAEIQAWDAYAQPTGIHYRPHARGDAHQEADWLDFQWCQTGHEAEHVPERVAVMAQARPVKAVANGEPTYENSGVVGKATGWWQGHEAWSNLCAGGTMGVVYGAGSLWQWVIRRGEPGHGEYFMAPGADWRDALEFEGAHHVGLMSHILGGLPTTDMTPNWEAALCGRGLSVPGRLHILYVDTARPVIVMAADTLPRYFRIVDPRTGAVLDAGDLGPRPEPSYQMSTAHHLDRGPRLVIFTADRD